jgi:hypothetical protein
MLGEIHLIGQLIHPRASCVRASQFGETVDIDQFARFAGGREVSKLIL